MIFITANNTFSNLIDEFANSANSLLSGFLTEQYSEAEFMLMDFLDPTSTRIDFVKNYKINPKDIYKKLISMQAASKALWESVLDNSQINTTLINKSFSEWNNVNTNLQALKDLNNILTISLEVPDIDIERVRVYPNNSNSLTRNSVSGHAKKIQEVQASVVKDITDLLGKAKSLTNNPGNSKFKVSSKEGKSKLLIENAQQEVVNAIEIGLGSSESNQGTKVEKVVSGKDGTVFNGRGTLNFNEGQNITLALSPTIADRIQLVLQSHINDKFIDVNYLKLMKIEYADEGVFIEQEIETKKNIASISVKEMDVDIPESAKEFFEFTHSIIFDDLDEIVNLKARNADEYYSELPEFILINSNFKAKGISNIYSQKPIRKFRLRSSFKKTKAIPLDVLMDIYNQQKERRKKNITIDTSARNNEEVEITLPSYPIDRPRVFRLGKFKVDDNTFNVYPLGPASIDSTVLLPKEITNIIDKDRVVLLKDNSPLEWSSSNSSLTESQFFLDSDLKVFLGETFLDTKELSLRVLPEPLNIKLSGDTNNSFSFELENNPGFIDGNLKLFYYTFEETTSESYSENALEKVFSNTYRIKLNKTGLSTFTPRVLDSVLNDVTSTYFDAEVTYQSGREADTTGTYSVDKSGGYVYFYVETITKLNFIFSYAFSEKQFIDSSIIRSLEELGKNRYKINSPLNYKFLENTISANTTSYSIPANQIPLNWNLIPESINIKDFVYSDEAAAFNYIEEVISKRFSFVSGISKFKFPFLPVLEDKEVIVKDTNGNTLIRNTNWVLNNQELDVSGDYEYVVLSYVSLKDKTKSISKKFYFNNKTNTIEFLSPTTEEVKVKFFIHSYHATYSVAEELDESTIVYNEENKKELKIRDLNKQDSLVNFKLLVSYTEVNKQRNQKVNGAAQDLTKYVTVLPKHIDVELGY